MILLSSKGTQQLPFTGHLRSPELTMLQGFSETQEYQKQSTLPLVHKKASDSQNDTNVQEKRMSDYFL